MATPYDPRDASDGRHPWNVCPIRYALARWSIRLALTLCAAGFAYALARAAIQAATLS